jgi:hypothetical protein
MNYGLTDPGIYGSLGKCQIDSAGLLYCSSFHSYSCVRMIPVHSPSSTQILPKSPKPVYHLFPPPSSPAGIHFYLILGEQ